MVNCFVCKKEIKNTSTIEDFKRFCSDSCLKEYQIARDKGLDDLNAKRFNQLITLRTQLSTELDAYCCFLEEEDFDCDKEKDFLSSLLPLSQLIESLERQGFEDGDFSIESFEENCNKSL